MDAAAMTTMCSTLRCLTPYSMALITEQGFEACVTAGTNAATFLITNKSPGLQCKRIAGSTLESQQATTSVLGFWAFSSDSKYCLSFKK